MEKLYIQPAPFGAVAFNFSSPERLQRPAMGYPCRLRLSKNREVVHFECLSDTSPSAFLRPVLLPRRRAVSDRRYRNPPHYAPKSRNVKWLSATAASNNAGRA